MHQNNSNPSKPDMSCGHNTPFLQENSMSKLYRFEVVTHWIHPEINRSKRREMVYDFTTDTLVIDERSWFNGQDFYSPKRSPHIYADWDKAETVYSTLDWQLKDWQPLADLMYEGSNEHIETFRLISVDENGHEEIMLENNLLADAIAVTEAYRQLHTA